MKGTVSPPSSLSANPPRESEAADRRRPKDRRRRDHDRDRAARRAPGPRRRRTEPATDRAATRPQRRRPPSPPPGTAGTEVTAATAATGTAADRPPAARTADRPNRHRAGDQTQPPEGPPAADPPGGAGAPPNRANPPRALKTKDVVRVAFYAHPSLLARVRPAPSYRVVPFMHIVRCSPAQGRRRATGSSVTFRAPNKQLHRGSPFTLFVCFCARARPAPSYRVVGNVAGASKKELHRVAL